MSEELDLSKPFFRTHLEGKDLIVESNMPNDQHGDFAFEWDLDGSQRAKWEAYVKELEANGTKGQLTYTKWRMEYNEEWDGPLEKAVTPPLSSYTMLIVDFSKNE